MVRLIVSELDQCWTGLSLLYLGSVCHWVNERFSRSLLVEIRCSVVLRSSVVVTSYVVMNKLQLQVMLEVFSQKRRVHWHKSLFRSVPGLSTGKSAEEWGC